MRSLSTPPSVRRHRHTVVQTTPVRNKTPVRSVDKASKSPSVTPNRSPMRPSTQRAKANQGVSGQSGDVFARLTANLPTRHTAPTNTPSKNKKAVSHSASKSGVSSSTPHKKSSSNAKLTGPNNVREMKADSKSSSKASTKSHPRRDNKMKKQLNSQHHEIQSNLGTNNQKQEKLKSIPVESPCHLNSKSLLRDSNASCDVSMSSLPKHDLGMAGYNTESRLVSQSPNPDIGMFQLSPATYQLLSEKKAGEGTQQVVLGATATLSPYQNSLRSKSTTPIGMTEETGTQHGHALTLEKEIDELLTFPQVLMTMIPLT